MQRIYSLLCPVTWLLSSSFIVSSGLSITWFLVVVSDQQKKMFVLGNPHQVLDNLAVGLAVNRHLVCGWSEWGKEKGFATSGKQETTLMHHYGFATLQEFCQDCQKYYFTDLFSLYTNPSLHLPFHRCY